MRRSVLLLVVISSVTFLLGVGRPAITDSDEGFYAEAGREMVPYLNAANVRIRTLISPVPARDIETVLLVTNR